MAASGCLAGGTGSWALLRAAIQVCHTVRQGQAVHACLAGFPAAPTGAKGQSLCTREKGPKRLSLTRG